MHFADLVTTSRRVAATRSRSEKIAVLADLVRRLAPDEIEAAVSWLAGRLRQGRIGVGGAAVRAALDGVSAAAEPSLTLGEVDAAFAGMAGAGGRGSTGER